MVGRDAHGAASAVLALGAGGADVALGANRVRRSDGSMLNLAGCDRADLGTGDVLEIETPGGGGYGPA